MLLVFATPFNRLFLLYVALLGLAVWTLADAAVHVWQRTVGPPLAVPRWAPGYLAVVVVLNALAWLARVVPAVVTGHPADLLDGTGLPTNPVIAQDLAFWLPVDGLARPRRLARPRAAGRAGGRGRGVLGRRGARRRRRPVVGPRRGPGLDGGLRGGGPALPRARRGRAGAHPGAAAGGRPGGRPLTPHWPAHLPPPAVVLGVLAELNVLAALAGAWGLASGLLTLGATAESRLPGDSIPLAAVALTAAVAVPNAVVAVLAYRGDPRTGVVAEAAGAILVGWILVELAFIREPSFFHPLYVAIGLLMVRLGRSRTMSRP